MIHCAQAAQAAGSGQGWAESSRPGAMSAMGPGGGYGGYGFANGFGEWGGYWAFRALGATLGGGPGGGGARPMAARADVSRGRLIPATEDLSALTATGEDPTILALVLCRFAREDGGSFPRSEQSGRSGLVVYEVLNQREPVTYASGRTAPTRATGSARSTAPWTTPDSGPPRYTPRA